MKLIDISTPKYPDTFTMVDDADYDWLNQWKWWLTSIGRSRTFYAVRKAMVSGKRKTLYMHRVILNVNQLVDHKDMNGLNNTRQNLRLATQSQNMANNPKPSWGKTSKYKGVSKHKYSKKFRTRIRINGKQITLGLFEQEEDAAWVYDRAARAFYGQFAACNFPPPPDIYRGLA
jgi:hypothetical protein